MDNVVHVGAGKNIVGAGKSNKGVGKDNSRAGVTPTHFGAVSRDGADNGVDEGVVMDNRGATQTKVGLITQLVNIPSLNQIAHCRPKTQGNIIVRVVGGVMGLTVHARLGAHSAVTAHVLITGQ